MFGFAQPHQSRMGPLMNRLQPPAAGPAQQPMQYGTVDPKPILQHLGMMPPPPTTAPAAAAAAPAAVAGDAAAGAAGAGGTAAAGADAGATLMDIIAGLFGA